MNFLIRRLSVQRVWSKGARLCVSSASTARQNGWRQEDTGDDGRWTAVGLALTGFATYKFYKWKDSIALTSEEASFGEYKEGLPLYSLEEVSKHSTIENRVWVTYKHGVYDITKFVSEHPGGEQILMAAGSSVEPFWILYGVHKRPEILSMLEKMRIGNLSEEESRSLTENMEDPYSRDPVRHKALNPTSIKPYNAEPPSTLLVANFLTPNELFYVRNHLPVPEVDPKTYELEIALDDKGSNKTKTLSLNDLKKFPKHTVTATIMCAGNRRSEMSEVKAVKGLNWRNAAVGNATWTGARLSDVLKQMGIDENSDYEHVQFEGLDVDPSNTPYGASIPFWKGISRGGDVLLAYEMNGKPLSRDHGYPIRVVVPGTVGARNVKWLGRIVVSKHESESHWQQNDYKGFSPSTDWDTVDFTKSPAIQELPVISSICVPRPKESIKVVNGRINVQGYAWSGGGNNIVRVDITVDQGKTWHVANFNQEDHSKAPQSWAWTLWSANIQVPKKAKNVEIWVKAVDSSYNTQPESFQNIWNLRGCLNNAYHRVPITLKW